MSDFTNITEVNGVFGETELDSDVDFVATGDQGQIIIDSESGWGDDWGEDWGGGTHTITISSGNTAWTNIDTP